MFKRLKDNPILVQQMRHARWPSVQDGLLLAAELTVVGLGLPFVSYAFLPIVAWIIFDIIILVSFLLLFSGPLLTAVVAVVATVRDIASEAYQVIRLSELTEHDIVDGYAAGAVYRLRALWTLVAGLALPLVIALMDFGVYQDVIYPCFLTPFGCDVWGEAYISVGGLKQAFIITLGFLMLFIVWNWLAIIIGIWMAFWYRQNRMGLIRTLSLVGLLIALQAGILYLRIPYVGDLFWPLVYLILIWVGIDVTLSWLAYRQAVKCVRDTME